MGKWDPRNYTIDDAFQDLLIKDNNISDIRFTDNGVMKEYSNADGSSKVSDYVSADNDKGHNSYDHAFNSDGSYAGGSSHSSNK